MISYCLKLRQCLPPVLAWLLLLMTGLAPGLDARATDARPEPAAIKSQVLEIPQGSPIEVLLASKEKIRGQLGEVTNDGFRVKALSGGKIEEKTVPFDQVLSVRQVHKGLSFVAKVFIAIGITLGVMFAISGIVAAATNN